MPQVPAAALAGAWSRSAPQQGAAQAPAPVLSPRLLGPRPQLCSFAQLRRLLAGSDAVVAVDLQGHGLDRRVIEALLHTSPVVGLEQVHLMTTKSAAHKGNWASRMQPRNS